MLTGGRSQGPESKVKQKRKFREEEDGSSPVSIPTDQHIKKVRIQKDHIEIQHSVIKNKLDKMASRVKNQQALKQRLYEQQQKRKRKIQKRRKQEQVNRKQQKKNRQYAAEKKGMREWLQQPNLRENEIEQQKKRKRKT